MENQRSADRRVAVVTGAGSGLGRAIAVALAAGGHDVALLGRRPDALAETAAMTKGGRTLEMPTDVTDEDAVASAFATVVADLGRIDLLVNNAGQWGPGGTIDEIDVAAWRATVDVNLTGMFLAARAAFAAMRSQDPQGGRIVNNGSISAHVPRPGTVAYTATKHAVTGLTKALSLDGRPFGIRVSQIDVGNAETEMTARMAGGVPQVDGSVRAEPTFDARHVADLVVHLAQLPLDVDVPFVTATAAGMPFMGRG